MVELRGMIEDSSWIKTLLGKTTVAQQLAEVATEKRKSSWDELVPKQYHDLEKVFSKVASEWFPDWQRYDHAIDLVLEAPTSINCRVYPLSPKEKEEQKKFLAMNLRLNHICRSNSPYASRFFLIRKKDGKFRPVQDYRWLNKWTIPNKYPLPLITELIHDLAGKWLFSKFDVYWGYNNICIKEGDEWKAAFKTSEGLFKPTVMFFGLTNSPATFQSMMDDIFQEEITQGWLRIYMDDAIIATEDNKEEHATKVHHFLSKLQKHDLFLKPEKCKFHQKEVEYLGVIIGQGSVKMDPIKVEGIAHWLTPTTVKDVRSFLGFCNFYCTFIPHFSNVTQPLNDLTKKNQNWGWMDTEEQAFQKLKQICASYLVLCTPDWTCQFILETDASGYALGAVIMQEFDDGIHPISFNSRSLLPTKKNYNAHNKELAGMIFGFKCRRQYFLGAQHPVRVCMDHKTYNTSKNHRKSQAIKPAGWNSSKISTTTSNTSPELWTQLQTSYPIAKTLTRGWILTLHKYSSPIPYFFEKSSSKTTKTSEGTSYDKSMILLQEDTLG